MPARLASVSAGRNPGHWCVETHLPRRARDGGARLHRCPSLRRDCRGSRICAAELSPSPQSWRWYLCARAVRNNRSPRRSPGAWRPAPLPASDRSCRRPRHSPGRFSVCLLEDGPTWLMGKYSHINVVRAANYPIQRRTSEPLPPLLARAVADENLRDAVFVSELQQSLDGVLAIQDLDAGLRFARNRKVAF